jgi:hypothetical protein
VIDPEKSMAHLFMMFDSGIPVEKAAVISSNDKRYLIRDNGRNERTVWIPVETTLLNQGFEAAWQNAALNYLKDATIRHGLADGWVQIIDLN